MNTLDGIMDLRPVWTSLALLAACADPTLESPDTDPAAATVTGSCVYVNTFSQASECKEYVGSGWTADSASADCAAPLVGADPGTFSAGSPCDRVDTLGDCRVGGGTADEIAIVSSGTDPGECGSAQLGCGFADGVFEPSAVCEGEDGGGGGGGIEVFRPFEQECVEPLAGEPDGASDDGKVCTWGAISACTEEGRRFEEYASCETVLTQRPYYPATIPYTTPDTDPRLDDTAYMAELDWVTEQVRSCACVCCHTSDLPPEGVAGWNIDAGPLWIDQLDDDGLAMMAGWVDSTAFGAFPAEDNNGFDRSTTGLPTTDITRMATFLEAELDRRGLERADFAETEPFGGPLADQLVYEPSACADGVGLIDGKLTWTGGDVRYLYVLQPDANAPGVPPNLDTPAGTLWRLDVAPDDDPVPSPVTYGPTPAGMTQRVPASGVAPTLTSGETYYLYALRDIYQPVTRCLFTAP